MDMGKVDFKLMVREFPAGNIESAAQPERLGMDSISILKKTNPTFKTAGQIMGLAVGQMGALDTCLVTSCGIGQQYKHCLKSFNSSQQQGSSKVSGPDSQKTLATDGELGQWEDGIGHVTGGMWANGKEALMGEADQDGKGYQSGNNITTEEAD